MFEMSVKRVQQRRTSQVPSVEESDAVCSGDHTDGWMCWKWENRAQAERAVTKGMRRSAGGLCN
jgi:hypothetical protein